MKKINIQHDLNSRSKIARTVYTPVTNDPSIEPTTIQDATSQTEMGEKDNQVHLKKENKKTKAGR